MSHALTQLRSLLRDPKRTTGTVQKVTGGTAYVTTPRGVVMAALASTEGLKEGASVVLSEGRVVSVKMAESSLPLFSV